MGNLCLDNFTGVWETKEISSSLGALYVLQHGYPLLSLTIFETLKTRALRLPSQLPYEFRLCWHTNQNSQKQTNKQTASRVRRFWRKERIQWNAVQALCGTDEVKPSYQPKSPWSPWASQFHGAAAKTAPLSSAWNIPIPGVTVPGPVLSSVTENRSVALAQHAGQSSGSLAFHTLLARTIHRSRGHIYLCLSSTLDSRSFKHPLKACPGRARPVLYVSCH